MTNNLIKDLDKTKIYSGVFYTDGGANPNPGYAGYGVHGYFFLEGKENTPKTHVLIANHFMEFFNAKPNSVDYSVVTTKGYQPYEQKTVDKLKSILAKPVFYYDKSFSFFDLTTNNVAELSALEDALQQACNLIFVEGLQIKELVFILDSNYVLETVTKYGDAYRTNGWMTTSGSPAKNKEIIELILDLRDRLISKDVKITYKWVKGHQGDLGNGMADYQATIGVRRSREADNPNLGRYSPHKDYWDSPTERHPFLTFKRAYNNRVDSFNEPGVYYMIEPSSEDLLIGKRSNEAYAIIKLKEPCYYQERVREAQSKFGQEENRIMLVRNEKLYTKFVQKLLLTHGHYCLSPSSNKKAVNFLDQQAVSLEHNPPALFYRVLEIFSFLESRLEEYEKRTANPEDNVEEVGEYGSLTIRDVTDRFYTVEEKKSGKETVQKTVLKPEFIVGYKNHQFHVEEKVGEKSKELKISLTLGLDLPNRNALKQLEDHLPKIYLLTWRTSPDVLQYAFVVDCITGTGIWSNYHCDRIFVGSLYETD